MSRCLFHIFLVFASSAPASFSFSRPFSARGGARGVVRRYYVLHAGCIIVRGRNSYTSADPSLIKREAPPIFKSLKGFLLVAFKYREQSAAGSD